MLKISRWAVDSLNDKLFPHRKRFIQRSEASPPLTSISQVLL